MLPPQSFVLSFFSLLDSLAFDPPLKQAVAPQLTCLAQTDNFQMVSSSSSKNSGASSAAASAAASDNPSSLNYFLTALLTIAVLYYRIYLPSSSSPTSFFFFSSSPSSSTLINSRSQVFLTWVNASSARCCNITIPSTITILSSPGISHPRSASHFDTQENGGSAPRSKYGTGRSVFENLYGKIVLPAVDSEPGWGEKGRITSGGQRGLYYDRRGFGPTDRGGTVEEPYLAGEGFQDCPSSTDNQGSGPEPSPPPVLVVPAPLHVTRTVALKSIYGAALQYLSPPSQFDRDIHVPKFLAHYPPPSVPSIPGRLTNSAPTPRLTIPSSKLTRPLALANLTPSLAALADPIILALFLARERYIGEASRFAPWIQSMQGVNDGVSWEFIAEKVRGTLVHRRGTGVGPPLSFLSTSPPPLYFLFFFISYVLRVSPCSPFPAFTMRPAFYIHPPFIFSRHHPLITSPLSTSSPRKTIGKPPVSVETGLRFACAEWNRG